MSPTHRCLAALATLSALAFAAGSAHAQEYRPDAEGYPCGTRPALGVIQDGDGFAIRRTEDRVAAAAIAAGEMAATAAIKVGATLKIDQQIFKAALRQRKVEAGNASRR